MALLWYVRGTDSEASVFQVWVAGFQISAREGTLDFFMREFANKPAVPSVQFEHLQFLQLFRVESNRV
jgi:hypothetical protein